MRLMAMTALVAMLSGCSVFHARLDNAARLINRTDFEQARLAAPEWCRDALKTINYLEMELEEQ